MTLTHLIDVEWRRGSTERLGLDKLKAWLCFAERKTKIGKNN